MFIFPEEADESTTTEVTSRPDESLPEEIKDDEGTADIFSAVSVCSTFLHSVQTYDLRATCGSQTFSCGLLFKATISHIIIVRIHGPGKLYY